MNYEEAMIYLEGTERFGSRLGLDRMRQLLFWLDSPEFGIPTMHIAGTNGKGSVSAYSAYMLASAGYRVGFFCSPYVYDFGERIRVIDGRDPEAVWAQDPHAGQISREAVAETLTRLRTIIEEQGLTGPSHPTHFEMLTLMAFMHFRARACDVLVLETGLGGRLDSTNIIPPPRVAVITAIGLDHTARLGNTYLEIAGEKAGILKRGTRALCLYDQTIAIPEAEEAAKVTELFAQRAAELGIDLVAHRHADVHVLKRDLTGQSFRIFEEGNRIFRTALLPAFEPDNAALAVNAVRALVPTIAQEALARGIERCYWPARLEKLSDRPVVLLDGGHNPQGAAALRESLNALFPDGRPEVHICSIMRDKDQQAMLDEALRGGKVKLLLLTAPQGVARAERPEILAELAAETAAKLLPAAQRPEIAGVDSVAAAVERGLAFCLAHDAVLVGWGTFYQAGEFRKALLAEIAALEV